jgi:acylphosphatase
MKRIGYHIKVKGEVQGVGYRYYCREAAARLGLNGYVMNMPDGSVEAEAFGDASSVEAFIMEISGRDRSYIVREIEKNEIPENNRYNDFEILQYPGN